MIAILVLLVISLLLAVFAIVRLALALLDADRLIETQRAAIILDEEHITILKEAHDRQAETIALLVGYNTHLEDRNARLVQTINRYILSIPTSARPQQIEGLRERLAGRSMN